MKLANNVDCDFTIIAKEVGVTQCENCEITIHEPEVIVITKCTNCEVTIYTKVDPEKLTIVDADNDDDTEITFIDPTDDREWNWPPEDDEEDDEDDDWDEDDENDDDDEEDGEEEEGNDEGDGGAGNGGFYVGGGMIGNRVIQGDGMIVNEETIGPVLDIGTEVLLPDTYPAEVKGGSYNNINLTGLWERQSGETKLKAEPGFRVYVRIK